MVRDYSISTKLIYQTNLLDGYERQLAALWAAYVPEILVAKDMDESLTPM